MIHLVDKNNRHQYKEELEQHYRIRYQIYVRERRWMELDRPDHREIDQFDTKSTIYLLAIENGTVVGGTRLRRTTEPHLMQDVFPFLANGRGLRVGPHIVEWTRIFVVNEKRGTPVLNMVLAGMLEYCLKECFSQITVVMETWWMPRFLALGWDFEPLGTPIVHDDMEIVGCSINVTEEAYRKTLSASGLTGPVLVSRPSGPRPEGWGEQRPVKALPSSGQTHTDRGVAMRGGLAPMQSKPPLAG